MTVACTFGFRVAGPVQGGRRCLIDAAASFRRHAENRHDHAEAYLSAFWYGNDIRERLIPGDEWKTLDIKGYDGRCWSPYIWFDIDRAGDLPAARIATCKLAGFALERYPVLD